MNKSKYSTSDLLRLGEGLVELGDKELGYALMELVDYRSREQKVIACSSVDKTSINYVDPDAIETSLKKDISRMLADKMVEDRVACFYQSYDRSTNRIILHATVNVLKGE